MFKRFILLLLLPVLLHGQVTVTTRGAKGSPLTFAEADANFSALATAANASLKKNAEFMSVFDFMSTAQIADVQSGAMTLDVTAPLQAAINACGTFGRNLWLPEGRYLVTDASPNNYCLSITKPITIIGAGFYTAIVPKSTVGSAADTVRIEPSVSVWCKITLLNFTIGSTNTGTRYGNRGVFLYTNAAGSNAPKFTMRDMSIYQGSGGPGYSFVHINTAANNPNGGMYAALIQNCTLVGGIYLSDSGDSNVIQKNIVSGSNIGILYSLVSGASCLSIEDNNITATGGAIKGDYGSRTVIRHNNIEMPSGSGSNGAIVDFNGGNGVAYQCSFTDNHISAFGTSTVTTAVRVRNMNGMDIARNTFLSGASSLVTAINVLDGSAQNVRIHPNTYGAAPQFSASAYAGGTTYTAGAYVTSSGYNWVSLQAANTGHAPEASPTWWQLTSGPRILDGGTGTCGVIKPLPALQNGWVYYGTSRSIPLMFKDVTGVVHLQGAVASGTTTAGTALTALPAGFYPKLLLNFNVHSLGGAVAGLGTLLVYGSIGAGTIEIRAGGNTILCLDGISFLADGLSDGASAE